MSIRICCRPSFGRQMSARLLRDKKYHSVAQSPSLWLFSRSRGALPLPQLRHNSTQAAQAAPDDHRVIREDIYEGAERTDDSENVPIELFYDWSFTTEEAYKQALQDVQKNRFCRYPFDLVTYQMRLEKYIFSNPDKSLDPQLVLEALRAGAYLHNIIVNSPTFTAGQKQAAEAEGSDPEAIEDPLGVVTGATKRILLLPNVHVTRELLHDYFISEPCPPAESVCMAMEAFYVYHERLSGHFKRFRKLRTLFMPSNPVRESTIPTNLAMIPLRRYLWQTDLKTCFRILNLSGAHPNTYERIKQIWLERLFYYIGFTSGTLASADYIFYALVDAYNVTVSRGPGILLALLFFYCTHFSFMFVTNSDGMASNSGYILKWNQGVLPQYKYLHAEEMIMLQRIYEMKLMVQDFGMEFNEIHNDLRARIGSDVKYSVDSPAGLHKDVEKFNTTGDIMLKVQLDDRRVHPVPREADVFLQRWWYTNGGWYDWVEPDQDPAEIEWKRRFLAAKKLELPSGVEYGTDDYVMRDTDLDTREIDPRLQDLLRISEEKRKGTFDPDETSDYFDPDRKQ